MKKLKSLKIYWPIVFTSVISQILESL